MGSSTPGSTRIRLTEDRDRRLSQLEDATGESTRSGSIDVAARYYVRMAGGTSAQPRGVVEKLMSAAVERGSLTPQEIAEIVDTPELGVEYEHRWSVSSHEG